MPLLNDGKLQCDRCGAKSKSALAAWRDGWEIRCPPVILQPEDAGKKRQPAPVEIFHCSKCVAEIYLLKPQRKRKEAVANVQAVEAE